MFDEIDFTQFGVENPDELKAALGEAASNLTAGLDAKNRELLGKLNREKQERQAYEQQFEGLDIERLKEIASKAEQDEESALLAKGDIDTVLNKRVEAMRSEYERQLTEAKSIAKRYQEHVLSDSIRQAATQSGALPEATEDFILRAKGVFQLDANGEPVAMDRDGNIIYGKDGKTPLTPADWAESIKESAPHLFPRASGAGVQGGNFKQSRKWGEMTEAERAQLSRDDPHQFQQLLKTR